MMVTPEIYIAIAIVVLALAVVFIIRTMRKKKKQQQTPKLTMLGMTLIVLGIIFGVSDRFIGYSFIGVGVLLAVIDAIKNREKK